MAAVMACGSGTVLSNLDAASHWRIYDGEGARVHVTTIRHSGRRLDGVQVHRARRLQPDDVTVKDGIPVTTVARTLVDLLPRHRADDAVILKPGRNLETLDAGLGHRAEFTIGRLSTGWKKPV